MQAWEVPHGRAAAPDNSVYHITALAYSYQRRIIFNSIKFNCLFQTHLRSISHIGNYMSQHNRKMQKQHINDSLCGFAYTLASVIMDIQYNNDSLFQLALIEDFHQMSDAHGLNNINLRGFHSLVKKQIQVP